MHTRKGVSRVIGSNEGGISTGWFGYGEDGDLTVSSDSTVTLPVDEDVGQIYKRFQNLTIENGAVLKPAARNNGTIILVKGDLVIDGTISVDKCAPLLNDAEEIAKTQEHVVLAGVMTGGNGGQGEDSGGIGGNGFWCGGGYGGGGYLDGGDSEPRPPKGISWPWKGTTSGKQQYGAGSPSGGLTGGAAPGGGMPGYVEIHDEMHNEYDSHYEPANAGDAYGGGAIWLFVQGNVTISSTGKITANGGMGANGARWYNYSIYAKPDGGYETPITISRYTSCGGSGGGGIIFIAYGGTFTNNGVIEANGGATPTNRKNPDSDTSGKNGTIRIMPFRDLM